MPHAMSCFEPGSRAAGRTGTSRSAAPTASTAQGCAVPDRQALLALAREAGMMVMLDAQIGRERYESVTGSLAALARFAQALQLSVLDAA
ncbi:MULTISPECIES: hypothetical protein [Burkholderia cepacia complex]|uniref:hypothetical protein n=1 Tax=Burkholderia cepacia complex TaxID=87882 RepID=UPI00157B981A|nr:MULTISPECIES: hypothetical protein [Burkholderia cepacia complex]NTY37565.1 hypothetical protein [Burkholderia diffusa]